MKKSRIAKFALLGASAAALAATLSTSTYAWYVSNKTATMSDGSGTTGSAGSDGSILVSWTGTDGEWYKNVDFADCPAASKTVNALSPIHYDSGWFELSDAGAKGLSSTAYIQFTIKVKSGKNVTTVTPTMTFSNWSGSTTQVAYVDDGLTALSVEAGQTFGVEAKKAVYVQQNNGGTMSYAVADSVATGASAHDYWEAVTGTDITWGRTPAAASGLGTFGLTADTPLTLTYTIFLEGGDPDCFNSCAGYSFDFDLEFTITTA